MSDTLTIRISTAEKTQWEREAAEVNETLAEYIREAVRQRARSGKASPWDKHLGAGTAFESQNSPPPARLSGRPSPRQPSRRYLPDESFCTSVAFDGSGIYRGIRGSFPSGISLHRGRRIRGGLAFGHRQVRTGAKSARSRPHDRQLSDPRFSGARPHFTGQREALNPPWAEPVGRNPLNQ
jgi:hypothetical protein